MGFFVYRKERQPPGFPQKTVYFLKNFTHSIH